MVSKGMTTIGSMRTCSLFIPRASALRDVHTDVTRMGVP